MIVNEKTSTIADLWDGSELKCTFRRTVGPALSRMWLEVVQIASTIEFSECEDSLIWQFTSDGVFTSQSMYKIISFRGVIPVFVPSVWDLKIPPRVHIFLWLLSKNKILTRDNLAKRQEVDTDSCLFCTEQETVQHLFFDCAVAQLLWSVVSQALNLKISSFLDVGAKWLSNKKFAATNIICSATLWSLWKLRNEMCFQNVGWMDLRLLLWMIVGMAQNCQILCPLDSKETLLVVISNLKDLARRPPRLSMGAV